MVQKILTSEEMNIKEYEQYMRYRAAKNIVSTYRGFLTLNLAFIIIMSILLETYNINHYLILMIQLFIFRSVIYFIEYKIFKNFEDLAGIIIYLSTNVVILLVNLNFYKSLNIDLLEMPWINCQINNFIFLSYFTNSKNAVISETLYRLIQIYITKFHYENFNIRTTCDQIFSGLFSLFLAYTIENMNFKLYITQRANMQETLNNLSKGMDKAGENLIVLSCNNINSNRSFQLFHISKLFNDKYNVNESLDISNILTSFKQVEGDIENNNYILNDNFDLEKDLMNFIDEYLIYHKNYLVLSNNYGFKKRNKKVDLFSVKFIMVNLRVINHYQKFVVINFKKHEKNNENVKFVGSALLNLFIKEVREILSCFYSQAYLTLKNGMERVDEHSFIENRIIYLKNNNKLNNSDRLELIELLESYIRSDLMTVSSMNFCSHMDKKIDLLLENFEVFQKLKQIPKDFKELNSYNLHFLLSKSFKYLESLTSVNGNKLDLNTLISQKLIVRTNKEIFISLVNNIVFLFNKISKKSDISISIDLIKDESNVNNKTDDIKIEEDLPFHMQIVFTSKNVNLYENTKNIKELDVIYIISQNNKKLAVSINIEYEEYQDLDQKNFICSLKLKNCSFMSENNMTSKNYYSLTNNFELLSDNEDKVSLNSIYSKPSNTSKKTVIMDFVAQNIDLTKNYLNSLKIRRKSINSNLIPAMPKRNNYSSTYIKGNSYLIFRLYQTFKIQEQ